MHERVIRFVVSTIRFIAMTAIAHRSDAWIKPQFKHQSKHGKFIYPPRSEAVDKAPVQTHLSAYPHSLLYRGSARMVFSAPDVAINKKGGAAVLNLLAMLLSGLFTGAIARWLYPGAIHLGLGKTILLGIGGSLIAGLAASWRDGRPLGEGFSRAGCIASVLGAMLLIFIVRHV